jgi:hypothetical protein
MTTFQGERSGRRVSALARPDWDLACLPPPTAPKSTTKPPKTHLLGAAVRPRRMSPTGASGMRSRVI